MPGPDDEPHIEPIPPTEPEPAGAKTYPWGLGRTEYMTRQEFEEKYPSKRNMPEVGKPVDGVVELYFADGTTFKRPVVAGRIVDGE